MADDADAHDRFSCHAVFLMSALGECWSCHALTRLWAMMGLPPTVHWSLDADDAPMLKDIGRMPAGLAQIVAERTNGRWRSDYSNTVGSSYWMNHCEHCDAKQGDFFVQGPNGPFWPYDEAMAAAIEAERLEGPHVFEDVNLAYSGAMREWRDRREGIERAPPPRAQRRRKNVP